MSAAPPDLIGEQIINMRRQLDEARGDAARMRAALEAIEAATHAPGWPCNDCKVAGDTARAALTGTHAAPAPNPPQPPLPTTDVVAPKATMSGRHEKYAGHDVDCAIRMFGDDRKICDCDFQPQPPLPQGVDTGMKPGQRCTLWRHSTDSAHWYEASIAETWEARRDKHHRCPYIEPSAPQAPTTFEQLVTAAGPLPTTGLASAEPAPGADPNCIECEGSGEESDCDYCYSTKPCRCLKRSREGMK